MSRFPSIAESLREAATLAQEFENTPLWGRENVREGVITIQQQAERFAAARSNETRADAATWARDGYQILSSALPDTYRGNAPDERKTGWQTAHDVMLCFGSELVWLARIRLAFAASEIPDATQHDPSSDYLRGLIEITGLSQREAAARIGIGHRLLKYYITTPAPDRESRIAPYPVQYALERLAAYAKES